jgi:hypothetical protein
MRSYYLIRCFLAILIGMSNLVAVAQQGNPLPIVHQKMQALKWLSGKWEGPAYLLGQDGRRQEVNHHLAFEPQLGGTMFLINENVMVAEDTLFRNLAFFGYDVLHSQYNLHAFTNGGVQMSAYVEVLDNKMIWRFHSSGHIYRYTAHLNTQSQWHQVGEVSSDEGKSWVLFLESTLSRVK